MTSMMQAVKRAAAAATFALALAAFGPTAVAQNKPSPGAMAAANDLIRTTGAIALFDPLIAGVVEQAKNLYLQQDPGMAKDLNEIAGKMRADLAPRFAELTDEVARIYASQFSEQELKEILAFHKSPVGKKLLMLQPDIVDNSMKFAQDWAIKLSDEVTRKMRDELKKKGYPM